MKKILVVDDEHLSVEPVLSRLEFEGYDALYANSCGEALRILKEEGEAIRIAILDCFLPAGDNLSWMEKQYLSSKTTGLRLGEYIAKSFDKISIVGYSVLGDEEVVSGFKNNGFKYICKVDSNAFNDLFSYIKSEFPLEEPSQIPPNIFIVHGHDEEALSALKDYLQNTLKLGEPVIIKEKPNSTITLIEKFETYAKDIDIVFVLMTPDDEVKVNRTLETYLQARPNVLFELGYFMGRLKRTSGKVILLSKSKIRMPSDLSGLIPVDISRGIMAAGEEIKRELGL